MDIKAKVTELVEKIKANPEMLSQFKENPVPVVETLVGRDLPDEQIMKLADLVKAQIDMEKIGSMLGGFFKK